MAEVNPQEMTAKGIKPGSFKHRPEVLNNLFIKLEQREPDFTKRANHLNDCYGRTEELVEGLLKHFKIPIDTALSKDGTHQHHEAVIDAISKSTQKELQPLRGPVSGMLVDGKKFRNGYKEFKTSGSQAALQPLLKSFENGFQLILDGMGKTCVAAKVMDKELLA